jgi:hypothetical protein
MAVAAGVAAGGAIIGGVAQYLATQKAAATQAKASQRAKELAWTNLDPAVVNAQAQQADIERATQRLALQANIDPALAALRNQSENQLLTQGSQIGQGTPEELASLAASNALASNEGTTALKNKLIDSALAELNAGATLPPDIQAEFIKAGLERSGMTTGGVNPTGVGGVLAREVLGSGALALKNQRQINAQNLINTASSLDTQRQQILATLFPSINNLKLANLNAAAGSFGVSNNAVPEVGLSGNDVAKLWLARVGAVNDINFDAADNRAAAQAATGTIINNGIGSITSALSMGGGLGGAKPA